MFQLTRKELYDLQNDINLKSQIATSSWGGSRKLPYVFTENGVAMLSSVLRSETLDKRADNVKATIYTDPRKSHIRTDLERHNRQYPPIEVKDCTNVHDRFLIIDDTIYLIGGSIKDLGKRIVAFCELSQDPRNILSHLY